MCVHGGCNVCVVAKNVLGKKIAFHFTVLVRLAAEVKWLAKYVILKVLTL